MKNFHIQIRYNGYYANFDKLGKNEVKFESDGFTSKTGKWITYEEVTDDRRPLQYETVLGTRVAKRAPEIREGQS